MKFLAVSLSLVLMGRPVFREMSTAELQAASEFVLEVEAAKNFTDARPNAEGCEEKLWRVSVKGVLFSGKDAPKPPAAESAIEVINNPTELFDCMARKRSSSGVSFSAPRYTPGAAMPSGRFLVFVRSSPRGFMVAAQNGWDTLEKKSALLK